MYIIIVGCGSLGAGLGKELSVHGHDVVIIDKDKDALKQLGSEFNGVTIFGTGIDEDVLKKAGIEQADVFIAVTSTDSVNIMATQVAKYIFKVRKVIARIYNPEKDYVYSELGIETICPNTIAIDFVKNTIAVENINILMQLGYGDSQLIEVDIPDTIEGKNAVQYEIPHKFKIVAVVRGAETLIPNGSLELKKGDRIIAVVRIDALETVMDIFLEGEK